MCHVQHYANRLLVGSRYRQYPRDCIWQVGFTQGPRSNVWKLGFGCNGWKLGIKRSIGKLGIRRNCSSPPGVNDGWHWASLLRWIWSISEYNLTTRDSPKRTLESGPCDRERRGSGPAKQKTKHNPCRPVGRIWRETTGTWTPECLARADLIGWDPKGIIQLV